MSYDQPGASRFSCFVLRVILIVTAASTAIVGTGGIPVALAADARPVIPGANWLGGLGANACSMSDASLPTCGGQTAVGLPWQCVELAQRTWSLNGWSNGLFGGVTYAYQIYGQAAADGFTVQTNGQIASVVPGDLIVHDYYEGVKASNNNPGHVAVVDFIDSSGVHVVEQNYSGSAHQAVYGFASGALSRTVYNTSGQVMPILGVVHAPKDMVAGGAIGSAPGRIPLDWLTSGAQVHRGQYILSKDGRYKLIFQDDGNLVLYYVPTNHALWSSATSGKGGTEFDNQPDGNLVIYGAHGAVWASGTAGRGTSVLVMQSDGNVVLYRSSQTGVSATTTWSTRTSGRT